jgi:hypothetical protein
VTFSPGETGISAGSNVAENWLLTTSRLFASCRKPVKVESTWVMLY